VTCCRSRESRTESYSVATRKIFSLGLVFRGLLLGGFLLGLTLFVLDIFVIDAHGLVDLGAEGRLVGSAE
jgi:hypothetical protein